MTAGIGAQLPLKTLTLFAVRALTNPCIYSHLRSAPLCHASCPRPCLWRSQRSPRCRQPPRCMAPASCRPWSTVALSHASSVSVSHGHAGPVTCLMIRTPVSMITCSLKQGMWSRSPPLPAHHYHVTVMWSRSPPLPAHHHVTVMDTHACFLLVHTVSNLAHAFASTELKVVYVCKCNSNTCVCLLGLSRVFLAADCVVWKARHGGTSGWGQLVDHGN